MNARARQLLDELLQMPAEDRALIAAELDAGLEGDEDDATPEEIEKAWAEEIERRGTSRSASASERSSFEEVERVLSALPSGMIMRLCGVRAAIRD